MRKNKKILIIISIIVAVLVVAIALLIVTRSKGNKEYKVEFDTKSQSEISDLVVKENEKIVEPSTPTKEGYVFVGWYNNGELFDFNNTEITQDMVLEAKWEEIDDTKIMLNVKNLTLSVNEQGIIKILSLPKGVKTEDLVWTSSDSNILIVDENGNIGALKEGTAIITVTTKDEKYTTTCEVKVMPIEVSKVAIEGESSVTIGSIIKLTPNITPSNATNKKVTWKSSNPSVATIDANGNVKGIKEGTVTITLTSENGKTSSKIIKIVAKNSSEQCDLTKIKATYGDINKDGKVDTLDATTLEHHLAGWSGYELDCQAKANADVNADGKVDEIDIVILKRYLEHWYNSLPVKDESKCDLTKIKATYGDINKDGKVDTLDATTLEHHLAGWSGYELDCQAKANADVNADGKVDEIDIVILKRYLEHWYDSLPVKDVNSCNYSKIKATYGDVDKDGKVTSQDNEILNRYIAGSKELDCQAKANADVNVDGKINALDSMILAKYLSGGYDSLPVK